MIISKQKPQLSLYYELKKSFGVSHKTMALWLDVNQSELNSWINNSINLTEHTKQIKYRLNELEKLSCAMEPEHKVLVNKIAFSPIYGEPKFGDSILKGKSGESFIEWYEILFSQFESYRHLH
jgi:hypothetical protein